MSATTRTCTTSPANACCPPGSGPRRALASLIEPLETRIVMDASGVLYDTDGDRVEIQLKGPGLFQVTQNDPDGDLLGSIAKLDVRGTTAKSLLSIAVKKSATGDGLIDLGQLLVNADLGAINAPAANLTGTGLAASGYLGKLVLHDVKNGADLTAGGAATGVTTLTLGVVGAGSDITFGSAVQGTAKSAAGGTWTAPRFGALTVHGDFGADLFSTAAAADLGKLPALASLTVTGGNLTGDITASGPLGAIAAKAVKTVGGAILGSTIAGSELKSLTAAGALDATLTVSGAAGAITAGGDASGAWTAGSFGKIKVTGGDLTATIASTATAAALGRTSAIAGLTVTGGDFTGDLFALGNVGNVIVAASKTAGGNLVGSTLTAANFGNITIGKNLTDTFILAGANLGADRTLGGTVTNADTFAAGKIGAVTAGGTVTKTVIGAGLSPFDATFKDGNDLVLGDAKTALLKSLAVKGTLDGDSFIGAFLLPATVKIGTEKVRPIIDSRFLSNASIGAGFLTFRLANDTGLYANDAISQDIAVTGHLALTGVAASFKADIDNVASPGTDDPKPITITPNAQGDFTLSADALGTLNGAAFTDGKYELRVEVTDRTGGKRLSTFAFTRDTQFTGTPTVDLSLASDTGTIGDKSTSAAVVTLVGSIGATEPGARVTLGTQSAIADNTGKFVLPNVALTADTNPFTFQIKDVAGNDAPPSALQATFTKTIFNGGADVVLEWNAANLAAITADASAPPVASRGLAITSLAMFDVVSAFDGTAGYYTRVAKPDASNVSIEAAIAAAAHKVLLYLYPGQKTALDTALATSLARVTDGAAETAGVNFGNGIADAIITIRSGDGFDTFVNYTPGNLPGDWQQTGPGFDVALTPQWATLTPFALQSPQQFRPGGPPALDSAAYATAFNEVKDLGSANSTTRTDDQKTIARFWADGVGTVTPAGHWNDIATDLAAAKGQSTASNARLLATLNVALADAAISSWDAKYFYESWRPITAIHEAENDGNAATAEDDAWQPLLITPPFPEYTSGHSTFSGAAASVLGSFFGENQAFSSDSPGIPLGLPGATRPFGSFNEAAMEAGKSRIYGGIHFQFANADGLATGDKVGDFVVARFAAGADTQGPLLMLDGLEEGDVFPTSPGITGHILDNLSGVATAAAKFDRLDPLPLTLDATGKFTIPAGTLAHGAHTLVLNATDAVGNAASPFTVHFTVDALDPTISLTTPGSGAILSADTRLIGRADGTGSPIVSLCYQFDGGQLIPILYDTATGAFDIQPDLGALAPGAHVLTLDTLDAAGHHVVKTVNVTLDARIPFTVTEHTPASFASEVGSTFRPQVFFSRPVDPASLNAANFYATDTTGAVIPATIVKEQFDASVPGNGSSFAWLFFTNPMPGASTVTVHLLGDTIKAAADQQPLDGDENGTPGGTLTYSFSTVSLTPLPGTSLSGKVVDPGVDLKPMTFDDFRAGPDGIPHTADDDFRNPIAQAKVFIVGLEGQAVFTDAAGNFTLTNVPGGNVKLAVDGNTATNAPTGFYFPEMVLDLQVAAGRANTAMDSMGEPADKLANAGRPEVYLPRLQSSIKQDVPADGMVHVDAASAANLTEAQRQYLTLEVQPGSILGANGQPLANPQIGISTVPPELVRDMLPPGVLQHTFDITIQAPDAATFGKPLELTFPNVFNAAPGEKLNFLSFDHTTGRLVIEGTATVSPDGLSVVTDPGTGITKPGWHGLTPPGGMAGPPGGCKDQCCFTPPSPGDPGCGGDGTAAAAARTSDFIGKASALAAAATIDEDCPDPCDPETIAKRIGNAQRTYFWTVLAVDAAYTTALSGCVAIGVASFPLGPLAFIGVAGCSFVATIAYCAGVGLAQENYIGALESIERDCNISLPDPQFSLCSPNPLPPGAAGSLLFEAQATFVADEGPFVPNFNRIVSLVNSVQRGDAPADQAFLTTLQAELATISSATQGNPNSFFRSQVAQTQTELATLQNEIHFFPGNAPDYSVPFVAHLTSADGADIAIRGLTEPGGTYSIFVPAGAQISSVTAFDARTNALAISEENLVPGSQFRIQPFTFTSLADLNFFDSDSDNLPDVVEDVLGTGINNADTDKDGVPDGAEVFRGGDPLGALGTPTKIVASTSLAGSAKGVVVGQASTTTATNLAFVATGSAGLAVVDVTNPLKPAIMSQITLQGDAGVVADSTDVAFSTSSQIAVVASGPAGLKFVDVSNPGAPKVTGSKPINATQVEIHGGIAYANDGNVIRAYSIETGDLFQTIAVGSTAVTGLAIEGDHLYAMDFGKNLTAFDLSGATVVKQDSESTVSVGGGQLTVGSRLKPDGTIQTVAYIAAESSANNATGGFATWDVTNPNDLKIISGVDANNLAGRSIALNGSGLAVNVGSPGNLGNHAHLIRVSDPANTGVLLPPDFVLPADPQSVVIANGFAFIADDTAGLLVVNYISPDVAGIAPTASLSWTPPGSIPTMTGAPVQAGSLIPIKLTVADDAQVASVELLKDGVVIGTDTSFPFEFGTIPAGLTAGGQTRLQIRATDTGGNVGLSNTLTFDLIADTTAPALTGSNPDEGGTRSGGLQTVRLFFNEALTQADLTTDRFTLTGPGGATVPVKTVTFSQLGKQVSLTFDPLPEGAYTLRLDAARLHDLSGNALGTTPLDRHFNVVNATKTFINAEGGDWNSPANWENGTLPTASDIVALPLNPGKSVTISSGAIKVGGILTDDTLQVTGGSLTLTGTSDISGILKVSNGADLIVDGLNASLIAQNPIIDGADLFSRHGGDFHFPTLQFFTKGSLTVENASGDFDAPSLQNINATSIYVKGGGNASIPSLTTYVMSPGQQNFHAYFQADGAGSVLNLGNITTITDATDYNNRLYVQALNGGKVDLHSVGSISVPGTGDQRECAVLVQSTGVNSLVDLSALTSFVDAFGGVQTTGNALYSELRPTGGGRITAPNLLSLDGVWTEVNGATPLAYAQWTSVTDSRVEIKSGSTYGFTGLTQGGGTAFIINAATTMPALQSAQGATFDVNGVGVSLTMNALLDIARGRISVGGAATVNATSLSAINAASFYVSGGSNLALPAATSYVMSPGQQNFHAYFQADGAGSVLNLGNITTITDATDYNNRLYVQALNGGKVDLHSVGSISVPGTGDQRECAVLVQSTGVNSLVDLSALTSFVDAFGGVQTTGNALYSELRPTGGGRITAPNLLSLDGVWTEVNGATPLAYAQWTSVTDSRVEIKSGSTYGFTGLTQGAGTAFVIDAATTMAALQSAQGADFSVSGVGASLTMNALLDLTRGTINAAGGATVGASSLSAITAASFYVSGGSSLSLPAATSYVMNPGQQNFHAYFQADGAGSVLNLGNITNITDGTNYNNRLFIQALNGGKVDLHSVGSISVPGTGDQRLTAVDIRADGGGSEVNLLALLSFIDNFAGSTSGDNLSSALREFNQGTILVPASLVTQGVIVSV